MARTRTGCSTMAVVMLALSFACMVPSAKALDASATKTPDVQLQQALDALAQRARPGTLGVVVLDLQSGAEASVNAGQAFPMMSVFKAPVAAAVLSRIDAGKLSLQQQVTLTRADVVSGSAVPSIGAHFRSERMTFTVEQLLKAAVSESDSTAADALVKVAGGPQAVTAFLRAHGIDGMRVDMGEAGVARIFRDLGPGQEMPANESAQVSLERYRRGFKAFLAAPTNRSTPDAAVAFLRKLHGNELLSPASTQHLLDLMAAQTIPNRLRAGVPQGVRLADKAGTSYSLDGRTAAFNDIGILSGPDGHTVIVAAFLTDSHASEAQRDELFADIARAAVASFRP
ncbi:class A beta-lactamase [Rhodanobacter koreensis]